MRTDKRQKSDKKAPSRVHKRGIVGYSKKNALLEEAITHMNTGKYGRSSAALKELLAVDPQNIEARRLFATLHLRLGSLVTARQAFESLANEAIGRQDYWLAESLLREYLAAGPRCVPFLEQLAHVYQEKGDEMAAVGELGKAIEILRDDPDADNPQKAAQLYSKIRELAPASSVALQLAPLFDVQTGEFLVRPSDPSPPTPDEAATSEDSVMAPDTSQARAEVEYPLPDVMPWELTEEPDTAVEPEPELATPTEPMPTELIEARELPPPPAQEDVQPEVELPHDQPVVSDLTHEETSFSFKIAEDTPSVSLPDSAPTYIEPSESPAPTAAGLSSPMPWEELADASIQIAEPETPPAPDVPPAPEATAALESELSLLPVEEAGVAPSWLVEESPLPAPVESAHTEMASPSESVHMGSAPLSAPMPWEQISDPAIQISVAEASPSLSPEESLLSIPVEAPEPATAASPVVCDMLSSPLAAVDVAPTPEAAVEAIEASPTESCHPPEPSAPSAAEGPPSSSFSWNSVFDKAWKFTAGTMAPSPTAPLEKGPEVSDEPQYSEMPVADETTRVEAPTFAPPSPQEDLSASVVQAITVSLSNMVEEEAKQDVASIPPVETPPPPPTSPPPEPPSHWSTGEVAVQVHRPSKKKKRWEKEEGEAEPAASLPTAEPLSETGQEAIREWKSTTEEQASSVDSAISSPVDLRPDWMQASETITFNRPTPPPQARWSDVDTAVPSIGEAASTPVASAIDVLFAQSTADGVQPHTPVSWSKPRPRLMARLHRVRIGISSFIGSCFSTTRSLSFLALMITIATVSVAAAGICAVGVMWMVMEDSPSSLYQNLTISPPRTITDAKKNGYFLLLGFDAPISQDPVQAGYERRAEREQDRAAARVCMGDEAKGTAGAGGASDHVVRNWIRQADPLALVRGQAGTLKSLLSRESTALARYQQWLAMPFDDWGFGQSLSPNCPHVLLAHRLFVLNGFNQDLSTGLDRLEADIQAWRGALGQAKTLTIKMLAVTAVQDDASMVSGLLSRADLDSTALARLSKMVRPLDQVELSVRWPMQSQFVWATKSVQSDLKADEAQDRPWHASVAAAMRLPVQRRANAYAEYYEAANKAVAGGRYTNLPKVSTYVRTSPSGVMDYLTNPVEHIVGIEPLPSWEPYVMRMIETDAQLRLAGLQAWLRRGPQDSEVLMRLAKAGQAYYDPFTGLPMLVNQRKGVIYSVGRDGKDQEGDDVHDVTAMIPLSVSESRRSAAASSVR